MRVINDKINYENGGSFIMSKSRKMQDLMKTLMEDNEIKDVGNLQLMLKEMMKNGVETLLQGELDDHLGYSKSERSDDKSNYRNGFSSKNVKTDYGEVNLSIPRDRNGDFEPELVPKNSSDLSAISDKVISMYAKGMSTRDISSHIQDLYGLPLSASSISQMTDKVLPLINEWQNRALEEHYPFIFMDAIHFKVKESNRIVSKAAYVVLGINDDGYKDVLGIWIGHNESSKFWLKVLTDLKNRGVKKVDIFSIDGLSGFQQAILATYPESTIQRCIIHQIRYSTRYVSYKHIKDLIKDLKAVYKAPNEEEAFSNLELFKEKWNSVYPTCIKSWYDNWDVISPFFKYSENIRKIMYTTNAIENLNRQYRKVTKGKAIFPTDQALIKSLYLATIDHIKKWTSRAKNWDQIKNELSILHDNSQ